MLETRKPILICNKEERKKIPVPISTIGSGKIVESFLGVPLFAGDEPIGVFTVQSYEPNKFNENQLQTMITLANHAAISLQNARFYNELNKTEPLRREVEIAREIQKHLLHPYEANINGFNLATLTIPAKEVGGDFYDILRLDENKIGLAIGDVVGKGVPAALFMAVSSSVLRAKSNEQLSPENMLKELNILFCDERLQKNNVALLYAILDTQKHILRIANSGAVFPLYYSMRKKILGYIEIGANPLGINIEEQYDACELSFSKGDILILSSDGIVEAMNHKRELYTFERLRKIVMENISLSASEIMEAIKTDVLKHTDGAEQNDDITLIVLKYDIEK